MLKIIRCLLFLCVLFRVSPASADVKYNLDEIETDIALLVNSSCRLPYDYEPTELVAPDVPRPENKSEQKVCLRPEAAAALELLFQEAQKNGHTLYAVSGYRSYYEQRRLFADRVEALGERNARKTVAQQGTSEHQLALAMDINGSTTLSRGLTEEFGESPEGIWVRQNAHRFGFIIRYPKDKTDITGIRWEPWHVRYVGKEVAVDIYTLQITLEEYHDMLRAAESRGQ